MESDADAEADFGADDDDDAPEPQASLVAISAQRHSAEGLATKVA